MKSLLEERDEDHKDKEEEEEFPAPPQLVSLGFHDGLAGKESSCNVGDLGSIPGLGGSLGEGND